MSNTIGKAEGEAAKAARHESKKAATIASHKIILPEDLRRCLPCQDKIALANSPLVFKFSRFQQTENLLKRLRVAARVWIPERFGKSCFAGRNADVHIAPKDIYRRRVVARAVR